MSMEQYISAITALVGLGGLWFGLTQYRASVIWKRLEFAANLIDKVRTDPDFQLVISFLDWHKRDFIIPAGYLNLSKNDEFFQHSYQEMFVAFDLNNREQIDADDNLDLKPEFLKFQYILYVSLFDKFFEYIEQVSTFVDFKLVDMQDVKPLAYLANRVYSMKYNNVPIFKAYLEHNKYNGVLRFAMTANNFWQS